MQLLRDIEVAMLSEVAASTYQIAISSSIYAPSSQIESDSSSQTLADLRTCFANRLFVKDVSKQWYDRGALRPSSTDSTSKCGVRISTWSRRRRSNTCL